MHITINWIQIFIQVGNKKKLEAENINMYFLSIYKKSMNIKVNKSENKGYYLGRLLGAVFFLWLLLPSNIPFKNLNSNIIYQ